jgi:HlyD family secretion protein
MGERMNIENVHWDGGEAPVEDVPDEVRINRRRIVLIAAAAVIVIGLILFFVMRPAPKDATPAALPTVTYIVPGRSAVSATVAATGTLSAKREMPVGVAGEGGMVSRVLVDAGDWVRAGQVLATVDPAVQAAQTLQQKAQIAAAQADAKLAQSTLDRALALVSRGFISKADIDTRTAARDGANAKVRLAEAQYREQAARFVLARDVESGQIVSSGSPALFRIAMNGELEMRAKLAEQDLAGVRVGMPVVVTPIGSSQTFTGSVWQVSPIIDPVTRQGEARVQLAYAPALRPGGFASANFSAANTQAPILPESAVMSDAQGNYVYIIDGQTRVARRNVKVRDVSDAGIAVLTGLDGTERVVYSAGAFLNVGEKVIPDAKKAG